MSKRAILCAKGGIDLSFFFSKNKKIIQRGFAALEGWANVIALFKVVLTDLKAPSTFPKKSMSHMF